MNEYALRLIACSSSADFPDPMLWGQWCRSVASAALCDKDLDQLAEKIPKEFRPAKLEGAAS